MIPGQEYCGDTAMREMLTKMGSPRTLHEIYGLFYGCIAAPKIVLPSAYLDLVLGKEGRKPFESLEDANRVLGNIMSLWNLIAGWKPEDGEYFYADVTYPETTDGLKQMLCDRAAFITFFTKGLDLGGLRESDLKGDVSVAFKDLATIGAIHEKLIGVLEHDTTAKESEIAESRRQVVQLEEVMIHSIGRINIGLRKTRMAEARQMGIEANPSVSPVRAVKIHRNQFCPCGSGKKYKKCCAGTA